MFDINSFATLGLYPGTVSVLSIVTLGHYSIEVIIEPEVPSLGGGTGAYLSPTPTKYLLKIRVSRKGKSWNYEGKISHTTAKVIAKFMGKELPKVDVLETRVIKETVPEIEVKHASTTKIR